MIGTEQVPHCPDCHGPMALRRPIRNGSQPEYFCPSCEDDKLRLRARRQWESRNARLLADMGGCLVDGDDWETVLLGA